MEKHNAKVTREAESKTETKINGKSNHNNNNKKRKEIFPYGNYRSYYGYRVGQELDQDPRLKVFKREWFQDKDCLDIGCNNGSVTIQIAKKFSCRSIMGVDIDPNRVNDAYHHLRKLVKKECGHNTLSKCSKLEDAKLSSESEEKAAPSPNSYSRDVSGNFLPSSERNLLDVVSFRQENFVQNDGSLSRKQYDTILCLSVSKWVHLNWGDDGLVTLFYKIWRFLKPGGVFVLEPQPWKSYESNRLVSEVTAMNYKNILHGPDDFQDILLDKIGFRMVEDLTSSLSGSKTGFNRPILAFYK